MIDKVITNIYNGIVKLLKFFGFIILLALTAYGLSYVSDLNTRELFIRLFFVVIALNFLYNLGK